MTLRRKQARRLRALPRQVNDPTIARILDEATRSLDSPHSVREPAIRVVRTAGASVKSTNGATVPGGYSGEQTSLYRNGALCGVSSMYYYPYSTTGWSGLGGTGNCGSGNYNTFTSPTFSH